MYKAHDEITDRHIGVFADLDDLEVGLMNHFDTPSSNPQLDDVIATLGDKLKYGYPVEGELAWLGISLERIF